MCGEENKNKMTDRLIYNIIVNELLSGVTNIQYIRTLRELFFFIKVNSASANTVRVGQGNFEGRVCTLVIRNVLACIRHVAKSRKVKYIKIVQMVQLTAD